MAAQALVKDKINYWENKPNENASIITLDKKPISIAGMREDELTRSHHSRFVPASTFQNLFENRLNQMPGKRENVQLMINADVENLIGNKRVITQKNYEPFKMEMPKMYEEDTYKFMAYTLSQHNSTILSTQTIANIGAKIIHKPLHFKHMKAGALKLDSYFLDKQFPIKQRGDNTCMIDFIWHQCHNKMGFRSYTYQKLKDELSEFALSFPLMSTQEVIDWVRKCHPNVSIHAYDSTYRKFIKHVGQPRDISLAYFIKDNHCYPITDEWLKIIATKANQEELTTYGSIWVISNRVGDTSNL